MNTKPNIKQIEDALVAVKLNNGPDIQPEKINFSAAFTFADQGGGLYTLDLVGGGATLDFRQDGLPVILATTVDYLNNFTLTDQGSNIISVELKDTLSFGDTHTANLSGNQYLSASWNGLNTTVALQHNGVDKLVVNSTGVGISDNVDVTGDVGVTGNISATNNISTTGTVTGGGLVSNNFTTKGLDLDNSSSINASYLTIRNLEGGGRVSADAGHIYMLQTSSSDVFEKTWLVGRKDAAVELNFNNVKKLETTASGATVTGGIVADSITSNGVGTFNNTISVNDTGSVKFDGNGTGGSLAQLIRMRNDVGGVRLDLNALGGCVLYQATSLGGAEKAWISCGRDSYVRLYYNNSSRLATSSGGVDIAGSLTATGEITGNTSDIRTKDVIDYLSPEECYEAVKNKSIIRYKNNDINPDADTSSLNIGVIANEWSEEFPELTPLAPFDRDEEGNSKSGEHYLTLRYEKTIAILLGAIQKLQQDVEDLKNDSSN